jgi:phospholipid-binding lipoprotein MlaA
MRLMPSFAVAALAAHLCGCATTTLAPDPRDPWERFNRGVFQFNDGVDRAIARPVAKGYIAVTPTIVRTGVTNFMTNLTLPNTIVNQFLQGKVVMGLRDTARFVLNSTMGLAGILDPGTPIGLTLNDEDFGQTFGVWGIPTGPYLVLPVIGPSTVRDGIGLFGDEYFDPLRFIEDDYWRYGLWALRLVDRRARLMGASDALAQVYDPYAFIRSAYFQQREFAVRDGNIEDAPADEGFDFGDDAETSGDGGADGTDGAASPPTSTLPSDSPPVSNPPPTPVAPPP